MATSWNDYKSWLAENVQASVYQNSLARHMYAVESYNVNGGDVSCQTFRDTCERFNGDYVLAKFVKDDDETCYICIAKDYASETQYPGWKFILDNEFFPYATMLLNIQFAYTDTIQGNMSLNVNTTLVSGAPNITDACGLIKFYNFKDNITTVTLEKKFNVIRNTKTTIPLTRTGALGGSILWADLFPTDTMDDLDIVKYYHGINHCFVWQYGGVSYGFNTDGYEILDDNFMAYMSEHGKESLLIGDSVSPIEDEEGTGRDYYYDCFAMETDFGQTSSTEVGHSWAKYQLPDGCKIWGVVNRNAIYNVKVYTSEGFTIRVAYENDGTFSNRSSGATQGQFTTREVYKALSDNKYYYGRLSTNIPIFSSIQDAREYDDTGDTSKAINNDELGNNKQLNVGDRLGANSSERNSIDGGACTYYKLISLEQLNDFFAQDDFPSWDKTLWGNNPIDGIMTLYWTPLNVGSFGYNGTSRTVTLCGRPCHYVREGASIGSNVIGTPVNAVSGREVTLFTTLMSRVYNDWRDFELFKYKLYLPYYGTIDLPTCLITGKSLKVGCQFFVSNKLLKYYVYINSVIAYEYEVCVGVDLPLTSYDSVGKARENLQGITQIASGAVSTGLGAYSGNAGMVVGGVSEIASGIYNVARDSSMSTWGTMSASGNINDPTSCYLIVEEQLHYKPANLNTTYGYPCLYIGTVSSVSGYAEIKDIRLSSSATNEERDEIVSLMRNGIIV